MHAFLITGGSYEKRKSKEADLVKDWDVAPFDIFHLEVGQEKRSIGIADIRQLTQNLFFAPQQSQVVVGIIDQAQLMTTDAQNALLKTLEEPPAHAQIILETEHASRLLPTVVSRCHTIHLPDVRRVSTSEEEEVMSVLYSCHGKHAGAILEVVDRLFPSREVGEDFLTTLLHILHRRLVDNQGGRTKGTQLLQNASGIVYIIRAIMTAQNQLSVNVRHVLVFDAFFRTIALDNPHRLVYN